MSFRRSMLGFSLPNSSQSSVRPLRILDRIAKILQLLCMLGALAVLSACSERGGDGESNDQLRQPFSDGFTMTSSRWMGDFALPGKRVAHFFSFKGRDQFIDLVARCRQPSLVGSSLDGAAILQSFVNAYPDPDVTFTPIEHLDIQIAVDPDVVIRWAGTLRQNTKTLGWQDIRIAVIDNHRVDCFLSGKAESAKAAATEDFVRLLRKVSRRKVDEQGT